MKSKLPVLLFYLLLYKDIKIYPSCVVVYSKQHYYKNELYLQLEYMLILNFLLEQKIEGKNRKMSMMLNDHHFFPLHCK